MRRRILAIGSACLLAVTTTITAPATAADMPVKAPPPPVEQPVVFEWWPLLFLIPVGLCIAFCGHKNHRTECVSGGGCFEVD
jgi:hypothetical protein